jgi:hypothetical protein
MPDKKYNSYPLAKTAQLTNGKWQGTCSAPGCKVTRIGATPVLAQAAIWSHQVAKHNVNPFNPVG